MLKRGHKGSEKKEQALLARGLETEGSSGMAQGVPLGPLPVGISARLNCTPVPTFCLFKACP